MLSDCRQGRHVGIQTGVAGTGRACSGKAWSAVNRMYLGGCFMVSFLFFFWSCIASYYPALPASRVALLLP